MKQRVNAVIRPARRFKTGSVPQVPWESLAPVSTLKERLPWVVVASVVSLLGIQQVLLQF